MIRQASMDDFCNLPNVNCAIRIQSLMRAYGTDVSFVRFFADGEGRLASVMDGNCIFHSLNGISEEWLAFFQMSPDIKTLYTSENCGCGIVKLYGFTHKTGPIMQLIKSQTEIKPLTNPSLRPLYELLKRVFVQYTPFDSWYVDISHRIRHDNCRVATVIRDDRPVACAMTVAEGETAVIIGGVATDASYRHQGLAQQCIEQLLAAIKQQTVLIAPVDAYAQRYYERFGFAVSEQYIQIDFT